MSDIAEVEGNDVGDQADDEGSDYKGDFGGVVGNVRDGPESLLGSLRLVVS